jgi:hypothetical protein
MDKVNLEINKSYLDSDGNTFAVTSICVEVSSNGDICTVIVATSAGEFYWFRLPADEAKVKTWRKV